jgi:hypothetical protein
LYGSVDSSSHLDLWPSNTTFALGNAGRIRFKGRTLLDVTSSLTTAYSIGDGLLDFTGTITASSSGNVVNISAVKDARELAYSVAQSFTFSPTFNCASVFRPTASFTDASTVYAGFWSGPIAKLTTASVSVTTPLLAGYIANPSVIQTNGTALTVTNVTSFASGDGPSSIYFPLSLFGQSIQRTAGTLTISNWRHFHASDPSTSGTYTMTTQVGVDIELLTKGTTNNIGLRNACSEVDTPTVVTLSVVGDKIGHTSKLIRLNNTSGGSLTLTSTPTITDGVDGELIIIYNGSSNTVVIQDGTSFNLRLSASTISLATRDSVILVYSSTIGDWIQIGFTNVV